MHYDLDFTTFYNQFYISSDGSQFMSADWDDEAYNDRLVIYINTLVVFTESYGHIQGELDILESENTSIDYSLYDHIVEGGIKVNSGILQFLDCPNSSIELTINLIPGTYRVRIYFSNMAGYDSDEEESNDRTKIEIWPSTSMERKVLKRFLRLY
ncbi:MAG: hypothetical protein ABIP28_01680 [Mucilaginibacter sp.]